MANNSFLKFASSMNKNAEIDKAQYQGDYNADTFGTPSTPTATTPTAGASVINPNASVNYQGGQAAYNADEFGTETSGGFQGIANNFSNGMSGYVENGTTMGAATPAANPNSPDNYDGGKKAYLADKFGETPAAGGAGTGTTGAVTEGQPTEGEIPPQGELPPEETPSAPTDIDMGTVTDGAVTGEAIAGGETVTESGEVIDPVAEEIQKEVDATMETGMLTYDDWVQTYGADTETDFQNAKAQLEFEMATWAANYGANAEKLYQMGLSNSGVSDIFGANAYAAYVGAMNQLYLEKIKLDRQNIELYDKYVNKYESDKAAKTEARNNNITNAYAYGLSLYDGANLDAVKTMMLNAGYEADVVDEAIARLQAVDPSMLPVLKAKKQTFSENVVAGYNSILTNGLYNGSNGAAIKTQLMNQGYSEEEATEIVARLDKLDKSLFTNADVMKAYATLNEILPNFTGSDIQKNYFKETLKSIGITDESVIEGAWSLAMSAINVKNELAASEDETMKKQARQAAYNSWVGSYTPEMAGSIKTMLMSGGDMSEEDAQAVIDSLQETYDSLPDSVKNAESMATIKSVYNMAKATYYPGMWNNIAADLKNQDLTDDEIDAIKSKLDAYYYSLEESKRPDVLAKADADASFEARVVNGYSSVLSSGNYNGSNGAAIKTQLTNLGYSEEEAAEIINRLENLDKSIFTDEDALKAYEILAENIPNFTGSKEQKEFFKDLMKANSITDTVAISRAWGLALSGMKANQTGETVTEKTEEEIVNESVTIALTNIDKLSILDLSWGNAETTLTSAAQIYGADSEEYGQIKEAMYQKFGKEIDNAFNNEDSFKYAYNLVGVSAEEWATMDDSDKMLELLHAVGAYANLGVIDKGTSDRYFNEWIAREVENMPRRGNHTQTLEYCDALLDQIDVFIKAGYINGVEIYNTVQQIKEARKKAKTDADNETLWNWLVLLGEAAKKAAMGS